ncbi:carbohydrate ABC transporter permease [Alicyclobacillus fodiniaquatilis]|uniref:Carbohydrate ABC transporter permease n=1 Tax=Alicyclobacillus fodiniaquatilis TaxID=1661150 RepID=A0ABW4JLV9_9BACL
MKDSAEMSITEARMSQSSLPRVRNRKRLLLLTLYLLLVPSFGMLGVFGYYPAFSALLHAFYDWHPGFRSTFVGLANFEQAIHDPIFIRSFWHVFLMVLVGITVGLAVPFVVAELLVAVRNPRVQSVLKVALIVPMALPGIVTILLWGAMLEPTQGVVDQFLKTLGLPHSFNWFGSPHLALISIMLIGFPWVAGLPFLLYLAALQAIPSEIREAAIIDGASVVHRLTRIDIPLVMPQTRLLVVLSIIGQMQNLIPMLLLTQGGPDFATMVPAGWAMDEAFTDGNWGYASALSVILFIVMLVVSVISWILTSNRAKAYM